MTEESKDVAAEKVAEVAEGTANVGTEKVVKKKGRGLSKVTATSRLKFANTHANKINKLFNAIIHEVKVTEIKLENSKNMPSFIGLDVPVLNITYTSHEQDINKRKFAYMRFFPVESNALTIPKGDKAWMVDTVLNNLKHILDVFYLKGEDMSDDLAEKMELDYVDFDDNGELIILTPEEVVAGWKKLFNNFADFMNSGGSGGTPIYMKDGKSLMLWIKLIRFYKKKTGWSAVNNGELAFPSFVGEGIIELYNKDKAPDLRLNPVSETIEIMNVEAPKAPTNLGGEGGVSLGVDGGIGISDMPFGEDAPF